MTLTPGKIKSGEASVELETEEIGGNELVSRKSPRNDEKGSVDELVSFTFTAHVTIKIMEILWFMIVLGS